YRLDEAKETAIYQWISSVLKIETIWDKPNALRPALPYATMNISLGSRSTGAPEEIYKALDTFTYPNRKVMTLTVNIYADNAYLAYMEKLINSINLPSVQDKLYAAGMAVWDHSDPVDISTLLDTKYEYRVSIDIFIAYAVDADDTPGEIQRVSIDGAVNDTGGDLTFHQTIGET
ncbi:MAG: hypothetical protein AB1847_17605, partial [bacterium]